MTTRYENIKNLEERILEVEKKLEEGGRKPLSSFERVPDMGPWILFIEVDLDEKKIVGVRAGSYNQGIDCVTIGRWYGQLKKRGGVEEFYDHLVEHAAENMPQEDKEEYRDFFLGL